MHPLVVFSNGLRLPAVTSTKWRGRRYFPLSSEPSDLT